MQANFTRLKSLGFGITICWAKSFMAERHTLAAAPFTYTTPAAWATEVLKHVNELLNDHFHLERKAATNALDLLNRWPAKDPSEKWVRQMTRIAKEEVDHMALVSRLLMRRGGILSRHHQNPYASALHRTIRLGKGNNEIVDRLLVSALIEARSAERFNLLGTCSSEPELRDLYSGLWQSEKGHYQTFLDLALEAFPSAMVSLRWKQLLKIESEIMTAQLPGPRMHSGSPF